MNEIRVGVAQVSSVEGDLPANVDKHLDYIARAHEADLDLLVFPELSLTGYTDEYQAVDVALRRSDPLLTELATAARGMTVVIGYVDEGVAAQFYNAAAALRDGELVFLHRKLNLPTYGSLEEGKQFAPGRYVETFDHCDRWRLGMLICADLWNPALVHIAALHGSTLLVAPVASAAIHDGTEFNNPAGWEIVLSFYAMIYGLPVVMANFVGPGRHRRSERFWGGSRVIDAHGREVARAGDEKEELVTATLDYEDLRHARVRLPTVRDSNMELVRREVERLSTALGIPDLYDR